MLRPEQARDLAALSRELGRQVGLVVSRAGKVVRVVVGGPQELPEQDLGRLRRGQSRLVGHYLLRSDLAAQGIAGHDLNDLAYQRWDYLAVLAVDSGGRPGLLSVAHLLPSRHDGQDQRVLPPFAPGSPPQDLVQLVGGLEEELARLAPARQVADPERAILISVTAGPRAEAAEHLKELAELARSAGLRVVGRAIQRRPRLDPRTLMGPGKWAEVLMLALRRDADILIFDQELTPSQAHNLALSTTWDLKFLDRTQLILDIFAQRAHTREGKLQVEMAQLRYLTPRLASRDDGLSRLTGGIGGRGPGETRLEIDRRRVRRRLGLLARELGNISAQRGRRRARRQGQGLPVISIVGYTNAGKSTLLNALTESRVKVANRLFATLDPTTRRLRFPREREVIITDTVGFIRDLPDELRRAFAATLEELEQADLLLHLADASHPQVRQQIASVEALLAELGRGDTPCLLVLNKIDKAPADQVAALAARLDGVAISALDKGTLGPLLERMEKKVFGLTPLGGPLTAAGAAGQG